MYFVDANNGWIVGATGEIVRITNATAATPTFTQQVAPGLWDGYEGLYSIQTLDLNTGWAGGAGRVVKTLNGGATWTSYTFGGNALNCESMQFLDAANGWVVGPSIYRTSDGGVTWTEEPKESEGHLWGVGRDGSSGRIRTGERPPTPADSGPLDPEQKPT